MKKPQKNPLEWTVFALSAILIVAVVAILVTAAVDRTPNAPDLRVELGAPQRVTAGYRIPVTVRNEGGGTAARVRIEATLESGGAQVERADLLIEFVPGKSEREGWIVFRRDPACCEAIARAVGFEVP